MSTSRFARLRLGGLGAAAIAALMISAGGFGAGAEEATETLESIPPGEAEQSREVSKLTTEAQTKRAEHVPEQHGQILRGVHPKSHGCVRATFMVDEHLDPTYQVGLFATPGRTYEAWLRYSNAAVLREDDLEADDPAQPDLRSNGSRGMAIKLLDVDGEILNQDQGHSNQDFLMINTPQFAFANVRDYLRLNRALMLSETADSGAAFFLPLKLKSEGQPLPKGSDPVFGDLFLDFDEAVDLANTKRTLDVINKEIKTRTVRNPLEVQYFGAAPFGFGPDRAMKVSAAPCMPREQEPFATVVKGDPSPNYLQEALTATMLGNDEVCFDFMIQVRSGADLEVEHIENATTLWPDEAENYQRVARIIIPVPQDPTAADVVEQCEAMAFSPWNALAAHQPLGGINRLRQPVYIESARHRGALGTY